MLSLWNYFQQLSIWKINSGGKVLENFSDENSFSLRLTVALLSPSLIELRLITASFNVNATIKMINV